MGGTEVEPDPWGEPRGVDSSAADRFEDEAPTAMSVRQRIRLMGKAAMSQQTKVTPTLAPVQKVAKGLKQHIHTEQYSELRAINKQTCVNGMLSLLLAIVSVRSISIHCLTSVDSLAS